MVVVLVIPFGLQASGLTGVDVTSPGPRIVHPSGLLALGVCTVAGALLMQRLGRANPWFMGSLVVAMGFTMAGITLSAIPVALSNAAQLVIGVSLGVRFTSGFLHTAPRWLASVALGTLVMMGLCAGFAWLLSLGTGLHPVTLLLGTSPGGITEMSITAKVLQLGVPVVTAFQVCRLVAVLLLANPLWHWLQARRARLAAR
jgi:membrane AbrB-like protein